MTKTKEKEPQELMQMKVRKSFKDILREIGESRGGINMTQVVIFCVMEYYNGEFRKERFGYMAGNLTAKGRLKRSALKATLEEEIAAFEQMADEEATEYLHALEGFYKPGDEAAGTFFIRTDADSGLRWHTFRYANGSSVTDREDWNAVLKALREALKEKYK